MRINLKIALCLVMIGAFFTTVSYWTKCGDSPQLLNQSPHTSLSVLSRLTQSRAFVGKYNPQELSKDELYGEDVGNGGGNNIPIFPVDPSVATATEIDCVINGEYIVSCRREGSEVFVPFTFLHKYFEVYGKMTNSLMADGPLRLGMTGQERFEWQHSYSKYYVPKGKYDPQGIFMNFENFNVEARDRVKCISAMDGVPVSAQWDVRGYLYPIQIAQFALSHFSKNRTEPKLRTTIYEDGLAHQAMWSTPDGFVRRGWDVDAHSEVMNFKTTESLQDPGVSLPLDQTQDFVLSVNLRLQYNGSVTIIVEDRDHRERHYLHYVYSDVYISLEGNHIYYGLGLRPKREWTRLTRDLMVDLRKGLALDAKQTSKNLKTATVFTGASQSPNKSHVKSRLLGLILHGQGSIDNLTLSSSAHVTHFLDGADWLLRHQDAKGGWPIPVERKFDRQSSGMGNLAPGWYSAMAQGQAMSTLTRAYHVTGDRRYLMAAEKAIQPFETSSERNGVAAKFLNQYIWYEEYPTVPSSFVLNGFVYSLIGLYDLKASVSELNDIDLARRVNWLYDEGMRSLRTLLPLFDSGVGSFYDLRHFTLGIAPNMARWDYHTTHIGQLLLLATVDESPVLRTTADRWIEYMKGKRAPHN